MAQLQTKKGRKRWYTVFSTDQYKKAIIGEVLSYNPEALIGRTLWVNLSQVTRDMRNQNIKVRFRIKDVKGDKAETEITGYNLLNTFIKRIVRSSKDKIDDSFLAETKDKMKIRVKPVYLTRNNTQNSVLGNIRLTGRKQLISYLTNTSFDEFVLNVSINKVQRQLKTTLSKIYPLQSVEIRVIEKL